VGELHTASVWQRDHGRRVTDEHKDAPAKRVERRGAKAAAKRAKAERGEVEREATAAGVAAGRGGESDDQEEEEGTGGGLVGPPVALYGLWQTEAMEAQEVTTDGRVPVNAFGNVDLTHGAQPPQGCTHVSLPRARAVAKELGFHAPDALVGFERYAGRQVPVLDGVVVATEFAGALSDACQADQRAREERAQQKQTDEAAKRWRKLLAAIWVKRRVDAEYGDAGAGGGAARAPKAAASPAAVEYMELDSDGEVCPSEPSPAVPAAPSPAAGGAAQRMPRNGVLADVEQM